MLRSEWIKLWSLRSTRWSLALGMLGMLLGLVVAGFDMGRWLHLSLDDAAATMIDRHRRWRLASVRAGDRRARGAGDHRRVLHRDDPLDVHGRAQRLPVLWSKVLVFAAVVLVLSFPKTCIGFFGASAVLAQHHVNPSLSSPGALRAVIAIPMFLVVLVVFTVSLGALIRNSAGAIAIFAGIIFVLPGLVGVLSNSLKNAINPYLPSNAASAFFTASGPGRPLTAPLGWVRCVLRLRGRAAGCGRSAAGPA